MTPRTATVKKVTAISVGTALALVLPPPPPAGAATFTYNPDFVTFYIAADAHANNLDQGPAQQGAYNLLSTLSPGYAYAGQLRSLGAGVAPVAIEHDGLLSQTMAASAAVVTVDGVGTEAVTLYFNLSAANQTLGAGAWWARSSLQSNGDIVLVLEGLAEGQQGSLRYSWDFSVQSNSPTDGGAAEDSASASAAVVLNVEDLSIPLLTGQAVSNVPGSRESDGGTGSGSVAVTGLYRPMLIRVRPSLSAAALIAAPARTSNNLDGAGAGITLRMTLAVSANPLGACCLGATCMTTTQATCTGRYAGPFSTCTASFERAASCCAADFNQSGSANVEDVFEFLAAWFAGRPTADVDGFGLSVQDVFDFLALWFEGC